jgi:hypothetical protein
MVVAWKKSLAAFMGSRAVTPWLMVNRATYLHCGAVFT